MRTNLGCRRTSWTAVCTAAVAGVAVAVVGAASGAAAPIPYTSLARGYAKVSNQGALPCLPPPCAVLVEAHTVAGGPSGHRARRVAAILSEEAAVSVDSVDFSRYVVVFALADQTPTPAARLTIRSLRRAQRTLHVEALQRVRCTSGAACRSYGYAYQLVRVRRDRLSPLPRRVVLRVRHP